MNIPEARRQIDLAYARTKILRDKLPDPSAERTDANYVLQRLIAMKKALADDPVPPPPPPVPARSAFDVKGALLVNANAASPSMLRDGGLSAVAHQVSVLGGENVSVRENMADLATSRWVGFQRMGWGIHGSDPSSGYQSDPEREAAHVVAQVVRGGLVGYALDTERHHLYGQRDHTEQLLMVLRGPQHLGAVFPLAVVTFAYSPFSPGQLHASNIEACLKYNARFMGEMYGNGSGADRSWGVKNVVDYMVRDGAAVPVCVAGGDKDVVSDVAEAPSVQGKVAGWWQYAPEQAGDSVRELAKVRLA